MSGHNNYIVTKDYMKEENFEWDEHQNIGMAQTISLFKKYLLTRNNQHGFSNPNMEEPEAIKRRTPPRRMIPPQFDFTLPRPPSFLEQELLPGIGCDVKQSGSSTTDDKSSRPQLTIFYAGSISVYDNVSVEKAQAIMLLAGESSFSSTRDLAATKKVPKTDVKKPTHGTALPSVCMLQAELPLARKRSIQEFLKKRRDRITSKSPYAVLSTKNEDNIEQKSADGCSDDINHPFTPAPFPSRLGFFFPTSTNKLKVVN